MDDSLVNIRVRHLHFKLYKTFKIGIEPNNYWQHYYAFKGPKPTEPFIKVYKFFT